MSILDQMEQSAQTIEKPEEKPKRKVHNINEIFAQIENETGTILVERDGKQLGDELDEETKKSGVTEDDLEQVEIKKLKNKVDLTKGAKGDFEGKEQLTPLIKKLTDAVKKYNIKDDNTLRSIEIAFRMNDADNLKMLIAEIPKGKERYETTLLKLQEQEIENASTLEKIKAMNIAINQEKNLTAGKGYKEAFDISIDEAYNIYGFSLTKQGREMCNNDNYLIYELQKIAPTDNRIVKELEEKLKQEQEQAKQAKQPQQKQPDLIVETQPKKSGIQRLKEKKQNRKNRI